jgi:beta-mannosidase
MANKVAIDLVAEGIDTVADIFLNGAFLLHTNNMHVTTRMTLAPGALSHENNTLASHIGSPPLNANAALKMCATVAPYYCPVDNATTIGWLSQNVNYLRKMPASFGWDFAPAFAPSGVHRNIFLMAYDAGYITDVTFACTPRC